MLARTKKGEHYEWVFVTNLKPGRRLVRIYRKKWNIETGFRINGRRKDKPIVRFFYFLLRALLMMLWVINNIIREYLTYKGYLRIVERKIEFKD